MEIPLDAQVECKDGVCGRSEFVLINPVNAQVTHLVVKENSSGNKEYIVPVDKVAETIADTVRLCLNKAELEKMEPFIETRFIKWDPPDRSNVGWERGMYGLGTYYYMPYNTIDERAYEPVKIQNVPKGELALHRGTRVEATDGYIGNIDEFIVDPKNSQITHLVMREGHLWGKKDVIIPVSAIDKTYEDIVFLNLDKRKIEALPAIPVHRLWA